MQRFGAQHRITPNLVTLPPNYNYSKITKLEMKPNFSYRGIPKAGREKLEKLPFIKLVIASVIISITSIGLVFLFNKRLPPEVPLLYGMAEDEMKLVTRTSLVVPGLVSLSITILNTMLSLIFADEFIKKTLIVSAFVITLLSAITTVKIILLVGNI